MEPINVERNIKKHYTRITLADGTHEDFSTVRGAIVFPLEKARGVILVGGLCKKSATVKILVEKQFLFLGEAFSEFSDLKSRFLVSEWYYQEIPETEGPAEHLKRKTNWEIMLCPAPQSGDFEYGVLLVNDYLGDNRLSVPQDGILANQFLTNWEDINIERPHAVIALACLLAGLEADPPDGMGFSEFNLESCLV